MKITLSGVKGRSTVTSEIEIVDLKTEENLQDAFLGFVDFLSAMGAEFPKEFNELLEEYYDD